MVSASEPYREEIETALMLNRKSVAICRDSSRGTALAGGGASARPFVSYARGAGPPRSAP